MKVKFFSIFLLIIFCSSHAFSWGKIGHRVVGEVASLYLTKKAAKRINKILSGQSLAEVSNWMDDIKSDDSYDYATTWHWVTIPTGMTYEATQKNGQGDIIGTINRLVDELTQGNLSPKQEAEYLKMLIHLVGDIHQPLHVGNGEDMGGNKQEVKWFWNKSNLHRVWDSQMIDGKLYSYTELAMVVNNIKDEELKVYKNDTITDWYMEAMNLRSQVYEIPDDGKLGYEYSYKNWDTVKNQLLKGGIRLSTILNEIYG
ncbi:MAG: hypothetical protein ACJAT1_000120 [Marivirga sp.]|jgi:hypothetical protein